MSEINNKILDIDGAELEIGCRVVFAINNRQMRIGRILDISSIRTYNEITFATFIILIEGTNKKVKQTNNNCCRIRDKKE